MLSPFRVPSQRSFSPEQLDQRLRAGLVGHWIGGGSGNTWFDQSGYGNHGTLTNGPTWTLGQDGKRNALDFVTASSQYVDCGTAPAVSGLAAISVFAWIWPVATGSFPMIVGKSDNTNREFLLYHYQASNRLSCELQTPASTTLNADNYLVYSQWQHVGFTYDGATMTLWRNGVNLASTAKTGTIRSYPSPLQIGWIGTGAAYYFGGKIDDVRIFNRGLSAAEIALIASPLFSPVIQPARLSLGAISSGSQSLVGNRFRLAGNGGGRAG